MKLILFIIAFGFTGYAFGGQSCKEVKCDNLPQAIVRCVVKKHCNPIIRKKNKEIKDLKKKLEEVPEPNKNRILILAGRGPQGNLKTTSNGIETEQNLVMGLQYVRDINTDTNLSVQIQTNKTLLMGIGLNF